MNDTIRWHHFTPWKLEKQAFEISLDLGSSNTFINIEPKTPNLNVHVIVYAKQSRGDELYSEYYTQDFNASISCRAGNETICDSLLLSRWTTVAVTMIPVKSHPPLYIPL